jgi:hypothetical protein
MTQAEEYFHQLAGEIPGVKKGKMFGAACMKTPAGKAAAMFWKDCMVVKLRGTGFSEALNLEGSVLFEPMKGRPMKEWVQISFEQKDQWKKFALLSLATVNE